MKLEWEYDRESDTFSTYKYFGKYKYGVYIFPDCFSKSIHFRVGATSGKKRSELEVFEDKPNKSLGGIKALFWIKDAVLSFPEYYVKRHNVKGTKLYITIQWEDSRRKKIYSRLLRYGFRFQTVVGEEVLTKRIKF